ncbi:hypothetical protein H6G76_08410 [Nostoc sp. FACHB-152]|uniref:hypothetical protein n=1 Tax=unclassified Nostoc TaxID=2593658 RepID=UPI001688F494|nr:MULTISPECIES: hypothetical protein [unclassified Nostoc]MBD2447187.1 hypothetical protein [Nostoc sp. FACHB-152]MBD2469135.1 hypothetical protein [Nostoc sp. FACHB-145]
MPSNDLELRTNRYCQLSSQLASLDNSQLHSLFDDGDSGTSSLNSGRNYTIVLGQSKIFVKRIPVTKIEYENSYSTKNLYNLPTYFNYGVGSIGLNVFRELVTHIKTTNWVLEGAIASFPLMYHYRIIPFSGVREDIDLENYQSFVEYWGNSATIRNYVLDRANANYELILFLEYIPHVLATWLQDNPNHIQKYLDELHKTITFLRTKEIIHFDAHFYNILTDGQQIYLTDFGLVLDKSFSLTKDEESFFQQNQLYDYGEILRNLGHLIRSSYDLCSEIEQRRIMDKYGIKEDLKPYEIGAILLSNIEQLYADEVMKLDKFYVTNVVKYRSIIALMQNFFTDMCTNNHKNIKFPHAKLQQMLEETGFISRGYS